jgi:aryl-alcohol dehydrogenase-like predicted oxidoreductase
MQTRKFGKTDMETTPMGFGSWAVGGSGWAAGWGPQDDEESVAAIRRALELGVSWIDTAAVYGLGHSEEIVARALEGVSERPYVFTKCSMVWDENGEIGHSLKAESVKRECENSLQRLRTDAIDLYQIHWPNPDEEIEEGWSAMAELKAEGKVRHIGVSNFDVGQMKRVQEIAPVESLQPPYSMLSREIEDEILYCPTARRTA